MRHLSIDTGVALLVVTCMVLFLFSAVPAHYTESQGGDYPYYLEIARSPLDNSVPSPWRFRLLNPLMAAALMGTGLSADASFLLLTAIFAAVSCVLMRIYLQQLGASLFAARTGALLFAASVGAYIPLRRYYGYTDALTNFFLLLALVLAGSRQHRALTAALGVGTAAKEGLLLLLPFLARRMSFAAASWRVAIPIIGVPVVVFLLLRLIVGTGPSGSAPVALSFETQVAYWRTAMIHGPLRWMLWSFAYSFGPVWLIAAIAVKRNVGFLRSMWLYAVPLLIPLVRTTDTERALMLLFPIVIPLAAHAIDECRGRRGAFWVASLAVTCTWLAQLTFDWVPQFRIGPVNAKDAGFVLLCILPVCAVLLCRNRTDTSLPAGWPAPVNT